MHPFLFRGRYNWYIIFTKPCNTSTPPLCFSVRGPPPGMFPRYPLPPHMGYPPMRPPLDSFPPGPHGPPPRPSPPGSEQPPDQTPSPQDAIWATQGIPPSPTPGPCVCGSLFFASPPSQLQYEWTMMRTNGRSVLGVCVRGWIFVNGKGEEEGVLLKTGASLSLSLSLSLSNPLLSTLFLCLLCPVFHFLLFICSGAASCISHGCHVITFFLFLSPLPTEKKKTS